MNEWGIPELRSDRLATTIPLRVHAGGVVSDPAPTLFIWRTASLSKARGMTVGFYVWDDRLEELWRHPERSTARLLSAGVAALVEPDFSLWADRPLAEQLWNTYSMRSLGRLWQDAGLAVIPNLAWSDERSFPFCFTGIPVGCPVAMTECRTAGQNDADRRAFLVGLAEGVKQVKPRNVCIYGGKEHAFWLTGNLPPGPHYTLLKSFMTVRSRIRARQERQMRERNQLTLFGGESWVVEEVQAA